MALDDGSIDLDDGPPAPPPVMAEEAAQILLRACQHGDTPRVKELLRDHQQAISARDAKGWSPLVWASFVGDHESVEALLEVGAGEDYRAQYDLLGDRYADDLAEDSVQATPAENERGNKKSMEASVEQKIVISPLHWAVFKGHVRVVWLLLLEGLGVNDIDSRGNSCLHLAAMNGRTDILEAVMSAGFYARMLNFEGHPALACASTPSARALLLKAQNQTTCPATAAAFGPAEPQFLCHCSGKFYSEQGSNAFAVPASASQPDVRRPVRISSDFEFTLRDAEEKLLAAMDPESSEGGMGGAGVRGGGGLSTAPGGQMSGFSSEAKGTAGPSVEGGSRESAGEGRWGIGAPPGGGPGDSQGSEGGEEERAHAASGAGADEEPMGSHSSQSSPRAPGSKGGPTPPTTPGGALAGHIEEEEEDEEEDEEDEDEDAATGIGSLGTGLGTDDGGGAIGLTDSALLGGGMMQSPGVQFEPVPLEQEPDLPASQLGPLARAIDQAKTLRANPCLIDRGEKALDRLKAWVQLKGAIEDLHAQRPAASRTAAAPVRAAVEAARKKGVSPRRLEIGLQAASLSESEVEMQQLRRMCEGITVATHAVDGDISRLRRCVERVRSGDPENNSLVDAGGLLTRLEAEVGLGDATHGLEMGLAEAEKVAVTHAEDDPTAYELPPEPEPTPEELAAREAEEKAKKEAAKKAKPKPKPKKKGEEEEPEPEPLPPLYPSPQLRAVWQVDDLGKQLERVIEGAREAGADEKLLEKTRGRLEEVLGRREQLWEQEIARIRVFEAERIKREKKKKKGKKKGKKKK